MHFQFFCLNLLISVGTSIESRREAKSKSCIRMKFPVQKGNLKYGDSVDGINVVLVRAAC